MSPVSWEYIKCTTRNVVTTMTAMQLTKMTTGTPHLTWALGSNGCPRTGTTVDLNARCARLNGCRLATSDFKLNGHPTTILVLAYQRARPRPRPGPGVQSETRTRQKGTGTPRPRGLRLRDDGRPGQLESRTSNKTSGAPARAESESEATH